MNENENLPSKTFCVMPWVHLNTWPNGKVYPCCLTPWQEHIGDMSTEKLEDIWNNDHMKGMRKQLLSGERPKSCSRCFEQEDNGIQSSRISTNRQFMKHIPIITQNTDADGHNHDFKLLYWDFRFSNICNFKCRMCGSFLSSSWREDEIRIFGGSAIKEKVIEVKNHSKVDIYEYVDRFIDTVEEVYFAGGEPLMMDEHYRVLEKLIEAGNTKCKIRYNTNLSRLSFKQWNVLDLWKHFEYVGIYASFDGFGKNAEYSRSGTNWSKIEENVQKVLAHGNHLCTSTTTNIFNIMLIPQIVDYYINMGIKPWCIELNNILTSPDIYNINILPDELKHQVEKQLHDHLESMDHQRRQFFTYKYQGILAFLWSSPEQVDKIRANFKAKTLQLDNGRNERFQDGCPELAEWFDSL
jgi:radical SAM protein with 4Fe4S-binding SPASM domain